MNALVAVSRGMRAVKLYSNKILCFLTGVPANHPVPQADRLTAFDPGQPG